MIAGLYRLHARLGSGATGVIYEALRLSDRTPVAVKLLRTAVAADAVAADRLVREAEALRLTWHPNVVELLENHGQLPDGTAYLVMELLRGKTLATRLSRQKSLTFRGARAAARPGLRRALRDARGRGDPSRSEAEQHLSL